MKEQEMLRDLKDERRVFTRVAVRQAVVNSRVLSPQSAGMCRFTVWPIADISQGGMCVLSEEKLLKHTLAFLNMDIDAVHRTISVIAKVAWCRKHNSEFQVGLTFAYWPDKSDKTQVGEYIYNLLAELEK